MSHPDLNDRTVIEIQKNPNSDPTRFTLHSGYVFASPLSIMVRRSSPNQIQSADDIQRLDDVVVDKRFNKRAKAKKNRRNRHYEKQFMRNAVSSGVLLEDHGA